MRNIPAFLSHLPIWRPETEVTYAMTVTTRHAKKKILGKNREVREVICKYCGKLFETVLWNKKYCTKECAKLGNNKHCKEYNKKIKNRKAAQYERKV